MVWVGLNQIRLVWIGLGWIGIDQIEFVESIGLDQIDLDRFGLDWDGLGWIRIEKKLTFKKKLSHSSQEMAPSPFSSIACKRPQLVNAIHN